jgi:tetratricopeptide (TPR) repeat protein
MQKILLTTLLMMGFALTAFADQSAYRQAIEKGKTLLQGGKHSEAFQQLQKAMTADPAHYESYFYLAVTSYRMGNLSAAEEYGKQAQARAPESDKASVQEMMKVITEKRKFERHEQAGDEAFNKGLMARAADEYRQAYLLFPNQGQVGLKAAAIYAERLDQPLDAALLWTRIAASGDEKSAAAARAGLVQHERALEGVYKERMAAAKIDGLLLLIEVFPHRVDPRFAAAVHFAGRRDVDQAVRHLSEAIKIGIPSSKIAEQPEFRALLAHGGDGSPFDRFLNDAFGAEIPRRMKEQNQQEQAAQRRATAARKLNNYADELARLYKFKTNLNLTQFLAYNNEAKDARLRAVSDSCHVKKIKAFTFNFNRGPLSYCTDHNGKVSSYSYILYGGKKEAAKCSQTFQKSVEQFTNVADDQYLSHGDSTRYHMRKKSLVVEVPKTTPSEPEYYIRLVHLIDSDDNSCFVSIDFSTNKKQINDIWGF